MASSFNFKESKVFKLAFQLAMDIFETSKQFPPEEKYSLTDQIRRSSRSVCANLAEANRKRIYPAHFVSKSSDADTENSETQVWLLFAYECKYLTKQKFDELNAKSEEIGRLISHMINNPDKY